MRPDHIPCPSCSGTGGARRIHDYVRGHRTEFCPRCDGDGELYAPTAARIRATTEKQKETTR